MSLTLTQLCATLLSDSSTAVVTPENAARIEALTLTDTGGAGATVTLWIGGESASNFNMVLNTRTIPPGATVGPVRELIGQTIPAGGNLFAQASVPGVVALVASGLVQSDE